jgi:aldose 1-epimerase
VNREASVGTQRTVAETVPDPVWGGEAITLWDDRARSWARLRPDQGANLVGFGVEVGGHVIETMLQPADESAPRSADQYGAPVLFPFPNRLSEGRARFGGRQIQIMVPPGRPWAIHGLVRNVDWTVEQLTAAGDEAIARFSIESNAATLAQFPFAYYHALTFRLRGTTLRLEVEACNTGDAPLPIGFGWHPYFRLPLPPETTREAAVIGVPAASHWRLNENLLPTGEVAPVPADRDFREPRPLGASYLDDVYTNVEQRAGASACTLSAAGAATLTVAAGASFREWVVYAPPSRPTICFEPYTCPTDALNLAARGLNVGLIVLPPGATWSDWIEVRLA